MAAVTATSIKNLADALNKRAEEFARQYLPGGRKDGRHWRCSNVHGGKGNSFYLNLTDQHKGKWRDEAEDSKGDILDLFCIQAGSRECGIHAARAFLGISEDKPLPPRPAPPPEADVPWQQQKSRGWAQDLWKKGEVIVPESKGSFYLDARMGRSLDAYPPCVRFLPKALYCKDPELYLPAIVFRVDDVSGVFRGIQRVFLERLDRRLQAPDAKRSLGPVRGGAIRFRDPNHGVLWVTEGPEKGLALWLVAPDGVGVWAAPGAGMMSSLDLPDGLKELVIMADHDADR
jgi:hypothetical protein